MLCEHCKDTELIEGIIEAVTFTPLTQKGKLFRHTVRDIYAFACPKCGRLSNLSTCTCSNTI